MSSSLWLEVLLGQGSGPDLCVYRVHALDQAHAEHMVDSFQLLCLNPPLIYSQEECAGVQQANITAPGSWEKALLSHSREAVCI
jgi:hypothetical protein